MRFTFSPDASPRQPLYDALEALPPRLRAQRLLTLATVGLASGPPRNSRPPPPRAAPDAPLLLIDVHLSTTAVPELWQALHALPPPRQHKTFIDWALAGYQRLQPLMAHPTAPPPRAPRPVARPAPPPPPSPPAPPPPMPRPAPPAPRPPDARATPAPDNALRQLVRNLGLGV